MYSGRYFQTRCIVRCVVEAWKVGRHVFMSIPTIKLSYVLNDYGFQLVAPVILLITINYDNCLVNINISLLTHCSVIFICNL